MREGEIILLRDMKVGDVVEWLPDGDGSVCVVKGRNEDTKQIYLIPIFRGDRIGVMRKDGTASFTFGPTGEPTLSKFKLVGRAG